MIAAEAVDRIVQECRVGGDRVVLRETSGRRSAGQAFADRVDALAAGFIRAGLRPGDGVLFAVRPSIEAIALILAILRVGGVVVAADLGMRDELFFARMALVKPRWIVAEPLLRVLARLPFARARLRLPPLMSVPGCRVLRGVGGAAGVALPPVAAEAPAFIVFTSGTTGAPRAAVHTQKSLGASVGILAGGLKLSEGDCVYSGEMHAIVPALLGGAQAVIPRYREFNPQRFIADAERFGATHVFGTPSDFASLIGGYRMPSSVRCVLLGAAPVDRAFLSRFREVVAPSTEVWSVYAMTEMLPVARVRMQDKLASATVGDLVGSVFDGVQARLGDDGELLLRGPHLFAGYVGEPSVEEHATGDLAAFDADGRLVLLGRKKDMIIRGHDNIYPALYEPTIAAVPGVRRCALVGVYQDHRADEQVVLVVEPEPEADVSLVELEVRRRIDRLDVMARPDRIVFGEIPLGGRSRKVDKRLLLQWLRQAC